MVSSQYNTETGPKGKPAAEILRRKDIQTQPQRPPPHSLKIPILTTTPAMVLAWEGGLGVPGVADTAGRALGRAGGWMTAPGPAAPDCSGVN